MKLGEIGGTGGICDTSVAAQAQQQSFLGSQGALDGVGWTHVTQDGSFQQQVAASMTDAFRQVGLPVGLVARPSSCSL